jgi:hypothetical protein
MRRPPVWPGEVRIDGHGGTDVHEGLAVAIRPVIEPAPHNAAPHPSDSAGPCALVGLSRDTQAARTPPLSRLT